MDSRIQFSMFAAIALCFLLHFPSSSDAARHVHLLSRACKNSQNIKSCMVVLKSNHKAASATNLKAVTQAALAMARKETRSFGNFFSKLLMDRATHPAQKLAMKTCANYVSSSIRNFSLLGLEDGSASLDVHYALDNIESCERALAGARVRVHSIAARMARWKIIYSAAYSSVVALENGS